MRALSVMSKKEVKKVILYPHKKGNVKVVIDRNLQSKHYCINCGANARDLNGQKEFGYYDRGTKGYCKNCNTKIEYLY